jgi:hypothetical protein
MGRVCHPRPSHDPASGRPPGVPAPKYVAGVSWRPTATHEVSATQATLSRALSATRDGLGTCRSVQRGPSRDCESGVSRSDLLV